MTGYDPTTPEAKAEARARARQNLIDTLPHVDPAKIDELLDEVEKMAEEAFGKKETP